MTTSWVLGWVLVAVAVAIVLPRLLKRRERLRPVKQTDIQLWGGEDPHPPGAEPEANARPDAETMPAVLNPEEWRKPR